jgi:hypothetical protein
MNLDIKKLGWKIIVWSVEVKPRTKALVLQAEYFLENFDTKACVLCIRLEVSSSISASVIHKLDIQTFLEKINM